MIEKTKIADVKGFDSDLYKKIYSELREGTLVLFFNISHDLELITDDARSLSVDVRISPIEIYARTGNILDANVNKKSKLEIEKYNDKAKVYVPIYDKSKSNGGKKETISVIVRYNL